MEFSIPYGTTRAFRHAVNLYGRSKTRYDRALSPNDAKKGSYERVIGKKNSFEEEITVWRKLYKNYSRAYLFMYKNRLLNVALGYFKQVLFASLENLHTPRHIFTDSPTDREERSSH